MEGVKCYCDLVAEVKTSHSPDNPNRIFYRCPKLLKAEKCKFWSWAEDLPPTQHVGPQGPATSSSPLKRNASFMEESSDFAQLSPSQKRTRLIEAALAEGGHSGPSISSPNTIVSSARNISALQPSPSVGSTTKHVVALPQTPTRSAKRLTSVAICSPSPSPESFNRSQQSSTSTAKDDNPFEFGEVTTELIGNVVNVIPDYIRKLDKKRIAAEKSLEVRNKKIEYLEDEVKRLKDRQKELELIIADYESKGC